MMPSANSPRFHLTTSLATAALIVALALALLPHAAPQRALASNETSKGAAAASEPWKEADLLPAAALAKTLADPRAEKPLVVCVGFQPLFRSAHIPGAEFHGPAGSTAGLADLKKWAAAVSKDQPVVLYCGCCPMNRCPNVRPAFKTLHEMGFTHLKVLTIPNNFETDWVKNGFPSQPGR